LRLKDALFAATVHSVRVLYILTTAAEHRAQSAVSSPLVRVCMYKFKKKRHVYDSSAVFIWFKSSEVCIHDSR